MPRRRRGIELGVLLLASEVLNFGIRRIPPITLFSIVGQTLLYMGIITVPWDKTDVCISSFTVLQQKDWRRLFLSAIEHGDDMHLYYNMASFLIKGRSLERRYGSKNFAFLLLLLIFLTNILYVAIGKFMTQVTMDDYFMKSCAIGFSGVIFALKVLTTYEQPNEAAVVGGIRMPGKYAAWAELLLIHILVPNASFAGHLAGILAGVLYTKTYFGTYIDSFISAITGDEIIHGGEQSHRTYAQASSDNNYSEYYEEYDQPNRWNYRSYGTHNARRFTPFGYTNNTYGWNRNYYTPNSQYY